MKDDKTIIEYTTTVGQYQKTQHISNWNVKKEETEWNRGILAKNIPKSMVNIEPQIQIAQRIPTKQDKFQNIYSKAYQIQTAEK